MGSGRWAVGSGQWAVGGGQWAVGSGQWAVGSGQWAVEGVHCYPTQATKTRTWLGWGTQFHLPWVANDGGRLKRNKFWIALQVEQSERKSVNRTNLASWPPLWRGWRVSRLAPESSDWFHCSVGRQRRWTTVTENSKSSSERVFRQPAKPQRECFSATSALMPTQGRSQERA